MQPLASPAPEIPDPPDGTFAIVIFDGLCNFCDRSVQFILAHDAKGYFRFAPAQSPVATTWLARRRLPASPGSIVLIDRDGAWMRSTATLRIARGLGFPWSLAGVLLRVPTAIRDRVYNLLARNRLRWFGRRDACRIPTPDQARRFIGSVDT